MENDVITRLEKEYEDLLDKCVKLHNYLINSILHDPYQESLMWSQFYCMESYLNILRLRMKIMKEGDD